MIPVGAQARGNIASSTKATFKASQNGLKGRLKLEFEGDEGLDAGGLSIEFFDLLFKESWTQQPDYLPLTQRAKSSLTPAAAILRIFFCWIGYAALSLGILVV